MAKYDDWDADYDYKPQKKEPEIVYVNKPIYKNVWFWVSMSLSLAIVILLIVLLPSFMKMRQLQKDFAKLQAAADEWNAMVDDLNNQIANFNASQGETSEESVQNEPQAIEANTETPEEPTPVEEAIEPEPEYRIGEKWIVDGQWELQITGVTETEERNTYSDKNPSAVYIVDYTYTNLGYVDETGYWQGLYMSINDSIVDNANLMGYSYDVDSVIGHSPQETPVGASCQAQTAIGVDNSGSFKLYITKRDGNDEKKTATFLIDVP